MKDKMGDVIVNVETTALVPYRGSIIEIGMLEVIDRYDLKPLLNCIIKPRKHITGNEWVFRNNNYLTPELVGHGIPWEVIHNKVQSLCHEHTLYAYNRSFDFWWLHDYGIEIPSKGVDLQLKKHESLQSIIKYIEYPSALMECFYAVKPYFIIKKTTL